ncbi:substrate-binding domain-containing protein [Nannocystaceae bacterium ST9]
MPAETGTKLRPSATGRMRGWAWAGALASAALLVVIGILAISWVEQSPLPPFVTGEPPISGEPLGSPKPANLLRVAGSGSNLPLTRELADAFEATRPWQRVRVHESIGSGGGIRAALDRAIDIGLISRPLKSSEADKGLIAIPYARVAVVFAANPSVPVRGLTRAMVLDLYSGKQTHWDDGSPAVVLQREPGDSSHLAAHQVIPGFETIDQQAWDQRRFRVLFNDRSMQEALLSTPGAIGLFDSGLATIQELPLAVLEFEGKRAREEAVRTGSYPLFKDLAFVYVEDDPDPLVLEFIAFVFSADGQRIITESGYVPIDPPPHSSFAHLREVGPPRERQPEPAPIDETGTDTDTDTDTDASTSDEESGR